MSVNMNVVNEILGRAERAGPTVLNASGMTHAQAEFFANCRNDLFTMAGMVDLLRATGPRAPFVKHDQGKPRLDLVPPLALLAVGRVLTHGAAKYGADNWRQCPPDEARGRYVAAAMRHLLALLAGEGVDPETGESHAAHAACCALFLAELRGGGA